MRSAFVARDVLPTPPRSPTDDHHVHVIPHRPSRFADIANPLANPPRLAHLDPPARSPLRPGARPRPLPGTVIPDRWDTAPAQVRVKLTAEAGKMPLAVTVSGGARKFWTPPDWEAYVRDVKMMAAATPVVILGRLQELASVGTSAEQPSQAEVERMRLMYSALRHLDVAPSPDGGPKSTHKIAPDKMHNMLALYESKGMLPEPGRWRCSWLMASASASYMAGLYPTKRICHLSDKPLPLDALPNVQPLFALTTSPSTWPIPPGLFEAVHALSLPSLCTAQDLRGTLHKVSSALKPGGTFYLVFIDPLPCPETLGRRLREWLAEHLLSNLEKQSRCRSPAAQLPAWLGEASLRGAGSVLTTVKFYATTENVRRLPRDPDPGIERLHAERKTKAELRSLVGRMLWRSVWGEHVTGDSWWWDDADCVDECVELGTFWEYHLIEAVKES